MRMRRFGPTPGAAATSLDIFIANETPTPAASAFKKTRLRKRLDPDMSTPLRRCRKERQKLQRANQTILAVHAPNLGILQREDRVDHSRVKATLQFATSK